MTPSYTMKVERAKEHITEANRLIEEGRPFRYTLESNYKTGERSVGVERNHPVIGQIALAVGDAVHNLSAALDHRVFELIAPHTGGDTRGIQFPFAKSGSAEHIKSAFCNRKIDRAAKEVWAALEGLQPHPGGNENLVLLHDLDIIDKHKLLLPMADYTRLSSDMIRQFAPDFPPFIQGAGFAGNAGRDVVWPIAPNSIDRIEDKELPVPVDVIICEAPEAPMRPLMPTLYAMTEAVEAALQELATL